MSDILEFDGPLTAYCFGRTYDTLTSAGLKREGQPYPSDGAPDEQSAWERYRAEEAAYKHGASQIAWRSRPQAVNTERGWYITSRLAAFP